MQNKAHTKWYVVRGHWKQKKKSLRSYELRILPVFSDHWQRARNLKLVSNTALLLLLADKCQHWHCLAGVVLHAVYNELRVITLNVLSNSPTARLRRRGKPWQHYTSCRLIQQQCFHKRWYSIHMGIVTCPYIGCHHNVDTARTLVKKRCLECVAYSIMPQQSRQTRQALLQALPNELQATRLVHAGLETSYGWPSTLHTCAATQNVPRQLWARYQTCNTRWMAQVFSTKRHKRLWVQCWGLSKCSHMSTLGHQAQWRIVCNRAIPNPLRSRTSIMMKVHRLSRQMEWEITVRALYMQSIYVQ